MQETRSFVSISSDDLNIFLREVYLTLDYESGLGYYDLSDSEIYNELPLGSWLERVRELGGQRIFYVHGHPTVVFFRLNQLLGVDTTEIEDKIREIHLEVWNTSRIPLFFVALPTELRIYSAFQKPARTVAEWTEKTRWLKKVEHITQIAETLQGFSRLEVESGRLFFDNKNEFKRENRVDRWLLKNLRLLRKRLQGDVPEKREYVHALIGRSIFIRYLEDRGVLVSEYFLEHSDGKYSNYAEYLQSKTDTFNLFRRLRIEFNGDIFPLSDTEEANIESSDLLLLRDFLIGRNMGNQPDLFFWAYRFDVIPVEVISSIYEEFYDENSDDVDTGTHYTPTPLADFVLSQLLTEERLETDTRVLDPACGSGVFLVEVFKRFVQKRKKDFPDQVIPRKELTSILLSNIVGIDVNLSAIQVAAFSLYLALMDYLEPRDIRKHKQLPKLIYSPDATDSGRSLFHANAFWPTEEELSELRKHPRSDIPKWNSDLAFLSKQPPFPLQNRSFDIIVGNPPWGSDDSALRPTSIRWCNSFGYLVGDKELSQSFICRVQHLLRSGGEIGLLVSTGVLFKHERTSVAFRQRWVRENRIRAVYNFAHVRDVFFKKQKKDAISPFVAAFFTPIIDEMKDETSGSILRNRVAYYSIKKTRFIERLQAVIIDEDSLQLIRQEALLYNDWLWKTYMWGNASDAELIGELKSVHEPLSTFIDDHGRGYQESGGPKNDHTDSFGVDFEFRTELLNTVPEILLQARTLNGNEGSHFAEHYLQTVTPRAVHALGQPIIFQGSRILIKRGVSRSGVKNGEIIARLTNLPFAVRNSIIGVRVDSLSEEERKVLLGIMRSSLAKYYHFLTCSTWGFWHYEIHVEEHLALPVCLPDDERLKEQIVSVVNTILDHTNKAAFYMQSSDLGHLEEQLDNLVFQLYSLSEEQKDLVRDLNNTTLEFFYNGSQSVAASTPDVDWLYSYYKAFYEIWEERLEARNIGLQASIFLSTGGLMCGMAFELREKSQIQEPIISDNDSEWKNWFKRLSRSLLQKHSSLLYTDMVVKELSDSSMFIIKRGEKRLWTKSKAREDARQLLTEVFKLEWQRTRGGQNGLG